MYLINVDEFRLNIGMGRTGIENRTLKNKAISNRHDLVDREPAAQLHEADRPAICGEAASHARLVMQLLQVPLAVLQAPWQAKHHCPG